MIDVTKLSPALRAHLRVLEDVIEVPPPRFSTRAAPPTSADPRERDGYSDPGDRGFAAFRQLEAQL